MSQALATKDARAKGLEPRALILIAAPFADVVAMPYLAPW
jgi:hypothetical protein